MIQANTDGELDTKNAQAFESHLTQCADCRREYAATQRLSGLVAQFRAPEPPAAYWNDLQSAVLKQLRGQTPTRPHRVAWWQSLFFRPAFAVSAVVALAFASGIFIGRVSAGAPLAQPTLPPMVASTPAPVELKAASARPVASVLPSATASSKSTARQLNAKKTQKTVRLVHRSSPTRKKASPPKREQPRHPEPNGYVVYSLEPPLLTLSSSGDSAASGSDVRSTDGSAATAGEVVAPVLQQLVVPLKSAKTQRQTTPIQDTSTSTEESQIVPII